MTPQERDLITHLLERLGRSAGQPKDPEADSLIRQGLAGQPDAPYYLVQTVLIQDMALANAQGRIAELERQLAAARSPAAQPTSFLGGLFGHGAPASGGAAPAAGPWARPSAPPDPSRGQGAAPQQAWGQPAQQPMMSQAMPMMASGGSGFLRQAATTAAGLAGGALLFEGISSLFGSHAPGILSNAAMQPGISETVVNNYYGSDQAPSGTDAAAQGPWGAPGGDVQQADYTPDPGGDYGGQDPGTDYGPDQGYDPGQDFSQDQDFSDQDFGGGSDTDLT